MGRETSIGKERDDASDKQRRTKGTNSTIVRGSNLNPDGLVKRESIESGREPRHPRVVEPVSVRETVANREGGSTSVGTPSDKDAGRGAPGRGEY